MDESAPPSRKARVAVGSLVLIFAALAAYGVITNRAAIGAKPVAAPSATISASPRSSVLVGPSGAPSSGGTATLRQSPTASTSPSASSSATVAPTRVLSVASAVAFGPDGTSDGDNTQNASRVLTGDGVNAWVSSWYATANFGNLKSGTGLLLDMGHVVSVSSVRVVLGESVGADIQLRLGDSAGGPADLTTGASASDVGGTVHLSLSSAVSARYVLIWFTKLPPDSAGTYQVSVYSATVTGRD